MESSEVPCFSSGTVKSPAILSRLIRKRYFESVATDISMPSSLKPRTIWARVNPRLIASSISCESSETRRKIGRPSEASISCNFASRSPISSPNASVAESIVAVAVSVCKPRDRTSIRMPRLAQNANTARFSTRTWCSDSHDRCVRMRLWIRASLAVLAITPVCSRELAAGGARSPSEHHRQDRQRGPSG